MHLIKHAAFIGLLIIGLLMATFWASAADNIYPFDGENAEQKSQQFNTVLNLLRCPTCQNQSIADSDAAIARNLRQTTYDMVVAGKTNDEIVEHMVARYGDFISYDPPYNVYSLAALLLPFLILLVSVIFVVRNNLRTQRLIEQSMAQECVPNEKEDV